MERADIVARLEELRESHPAADLAFYAYRDVNRTGPWPFLLAALERNPVSIEGARDMSDAEMIGNVTDMPGESIYDEAGRLAQPDEVWNYGRGDGVEKAILLANLLRERRPGTRLELAVEPEQARLSIDGEEFTFASAKGLKPGLWPLTEWLADEV